MNESSAKSRVYRRYPRLCKTVLALMGMIGTLITAELLARLFFPDSIPGRDTPRYAFWKYDPLVGWAHQPNQRGRFVGRDFSIEVCNNSRGLRDDEYPLERNDKKRLLILGDSFGWGFGVELHHRFSEILESRHTDWEVINASVSGYSTAQEYLFLKERGWLYRPDVVLLLMYENDFPGNTEPRSRGGYNKPCCRMQNGRVEWIHLPVPAALCRQRIERFCLGNSIILRKVYGGCAAVNLWISSNSNKPVLNDSFRKEQMDIAGYLIGAINQFCQDKHARLIVVSYRLNPEQIQSIETVCRAETIPFLPLDPALKTSGQSYTFPHDTHWNATGHRIAADAIDAFLRQQGIFSASPVSGSP